MKILNLYAGIGGNRKLWKDVEVTAVEINPDIAKIYSDFFPDDEIIVGDAHQYLLEHYNEFDFIWSSPPCPTHSRIRKMNIKQNPPIYPNMELYEEILLLDGYVNSKWVVENVISWYNPLIKPYEVGNHYFWSNFIISELPKSTRCHNASINELQNRKGFDLTNKKCPIEKRFILRNCVEPELGKHIFDCAFRIEQKKIIN